jgi:superfamily II DNA or RNA helicase
MRLRPYQVSAEDDVRAALRIAQSALLVLSTGAGKTVVFADISRKAADKGKRILILAHRDTLIKQASAKLMDYGVEHGIIMAGFTPSRHAMVQVASVQTLVRRLDKVKLDFDLVVIDEAHLSAATSYRKIMAAVLEQNPKCKLLGVTGSPCRLDGKGLGREAGGLYDDLVQGISIKELIEQAYLVRPAVYAPAEQIDLSGVKVIGNEYEAKSLAEVMDKPKITGDAIAQYKKICPGVPAVAWCANVAHAQHVAAEFNANGIPAMALSGEDDPAERDKALRALSSGKIKVVTFAMLLVEGVDCPAIGAIIMLRPTMSLASYLQVIGRGLRPVYAPGMPLDTVEQRRAAIKAGPKGDRCFVLDHAGLTFKHGFADEVREWSLEGVRKKKGAKKKDEPTLAVKQCPKCFLVHEPAPVCPACGHVYEQRGGPEHVDGELAEITPEMAEMLKAQRKREVQKAKTLEQLQELAKQRGYSEKWAEIMFAQKQRVREKYRRPEPPLEVYMDR